MIKEELESWRFEVKFILQQKDEETLIDWICSTPFIYRPFLPRIVNSIYLDNLDLETAQTNIDGLHNRYKYRFRFYGNTWDIKNSFFEIKKKRGRLGKKYKSDFLINPYEFFLKKYKEREKILMSIPAMSKCHNFSVDLMPVLSVIYEREYYQAPNMLRITIDRNLHFKMIENEKYNTSITNLFDPMIIVEFKYPPHQNEKVLKIINNFPFRAMRSSKYLHAMNKLGLAQYI